MRIYLHIGLDAWGSTRIQQTLAEKREGLIAKGILFPRSPGAKNHTRLYMAVTDPDHVDTLRFNRGFIDPAKQAQLLASVGRDIAKEVEQHQPNCLILSATQLGQSLVHPGEFQRLKDLLTPLSDDIRIIAHVEEQGRMMARYYAEQILEGRATSLEPEVEMAGTDTWWADALEQRRPDNPQHGVFAEAQAPAFWLDYRALVANWEKAFGAGNVILRAFDPDLFASENLTDEIRESFGIEDNIGKATPETPPEQPSAAWLTRARGLNDLILRLLAKGDRVMPRKLWRRFISDVQIAGDPLKPGTLVDISKGFEKDNKALLKDHPGLTEAAMKRDRALPAWEEEADPQFGFRASQYLLANLYRIDRASKEALAEKQDQIAKMGNDAPTAAEVREIHVDGLTPVADRLMPALAKEKFVGLQNSSFKPHNRLGRVNEEELAAAFATAPPRDLPDGSTGNVIVGCMKNEAPYIVEWVAYHRAIGVDNFLIYTNGCEDGTSEILDRLQEMGIVQHRNNDDWKGNSPQQWALDNALEEEVIKNADWIIHIDVDEFINVRCGNGTLQDFFAEVPDATNVAMTWRLFGHNGVTELKDDFVIEQFDSCAPKFCPKPHTVWGFKTMFKNFGAYAKISCHRPNKLTDGYETRVKWVNGSGKDMTHEAIKNGWRSSKKSIGYDLIQLNHYALRSAESFLIKRQRGRALHVDRSIGLNYWIRMDWSDFKDITIKRNVPRLREEYDRLLADDTLRGWHETGLAWHRAKADELHGMPEFQELYEQALEVKLTETERVAYALALDLES